MTSTLRQRRVPRPKTRSEAKETQERRLLIAMAQLVGRSGYGPTSIAQVIERAGVSRKTFYEFFPDKEACFLEAYRQISGSAVRALVDAGAGLSGDARSEAQLARYLALLTEDPNGSRAFIVEVLSAGPAALAERERVNARFADEVFGHVAEDPLVRRAIIGGVNELAVGALLAGRGDVRALLPSLRAFVTGRGRAR